MEKVHSGISNLEALTNKLKKSFVTDDDATEIVEEETPKVVAKPKALIQKESKSIKKKLHKNPSISLA